MACGRVCDFRKKKKGIKGIGGKVITLVKPYCM
jgi:hypothetical protein